MSFECGMKWLEYRELVKTGTIDEVKSLLRDIRVHALTQHDGRVWDCIDHLQKYPSSLKTRSSWRKIFQMVTAPDFIWAASKGAKFFRSSEKQKLVFLPNSENSNSHLIIYVRKSLVGKGAFRKVKKAYDLGLGQYIVHKNMCMDEVDLLMPYRGSIGLESLLGCFHYQSKNKEKLKCIEKLYTNELSNRDKLTTTSLFVVFRDVLSGLALFHQGRFQQEGVQEEFKNFHHDIKLGNIVVQKDEAGEIVEACLIDFGASCKPEKVRGTPLYFSPENASEFIRERSELQKNKTLTPEPVLRHYAAFGQLSDLWALGIAFATLLFSRDLTGLSCHRNTAGAYLIENCLTIMNLKQEEIDQELFMGKMSQGKDRKILWEIVQGLLRVNPVERLSAQQALQMLRS